MIFFNQQFYYSSTPCGLLLFSKCAKWTEMTIVPTTTSNQPWKYVEIERVIWKGYKNVKEKNHYCINRYETLEKTKKFPQEQTKFLEKLFGWEVH